MSELLLRLNTAAWVLHSFLFFALLGWRLANASADPRAPIFVQDVQMGDDDAVWYDVGLRRTDARVDLWALTIAFTAVTAIAHFLYATHWRGAYEHNIRSGVQYLRWIEYGLSATPMYVIVSMLAGARLASTLALVAACSLATMLQGYVLEASLAKNQPGLAGAALLAGWTLFAGNWTLILGEWYLGLRDSRDTVRNDVVDADPSDGPPDNLEALIVVMFLLFASFGAVACYRFLSCVLPGFGPCDYVRVEVAYVSLSFAAKFILAIWLMTSVFVEIPWLNQICGCFGDGCVPGQLPG